MQWEEEQKAHFSTCVEGTAGSCAYCMLMLEAWAAAVDQTNSNQRIVGLTLNLKLKKKRLPIGVWSLSAGQILLISSFQRAIQKTDFGRIQA